MKPKLIAIALALAIFASGTISGIVIERHLLSDDEATLDEPERRGRGRQLARFRDRLDLSEAQSQAIDEILTRSRSQAAAAREDSQKEIMAILTPEQAEKYQRMIARREQRRLRHPGRRGPGRGPGPGHGPGRHRPPR